MCGILAIFGRYNEANAHECLDKLKHRGPDACASFSDEKFYLGHQRLAIQDLSEAAIQPMWTDEKDAVIIFNGEIYNHWQLRRDTLSSFDFKTQSDTETLLVGLKQFGIDFCSSLNGIYSFCYIEYLKNEVYCVRDPFGIKPLYYYCTESSLLFSSEIKAISHFDHFNSEWDAQSLLDYTEYLYSPSRDTAFRQVKKVAAGHFIHFKLGNFTNLIQQKYYQIDFKGIYSKSNEIDLTNKLDRILQDSIQRQLLSDVPVGFFLSGGLDSSLIVAIAQKILKREKLPCYTIDSDSNTSSDGFTDDTRYARKVAKLLDCELHEVKTKTPTLSDLRKMIVQLDEPTADPAALHVKNICKAARDNGIFVLLGGTGADDIFSGYRRHQSLYYHQIFNIFPFKLRWLMKILVSNTDKGMPYFRRLSKFLDANVQKNPKEQLFNSYSWSPHHIVKQLFHSDYSKYFKKDSHFHLRNTLQEIPHEHEVLNQMLYLEIKHFLGDHNLNYTDKMSMAHGVEVRVPYLDKELVEFTTELAPNLKMRGNNTKFLLRKVAERYLPKEVIYRPKSGFGSPLRIWLKAELGIELEQLFNSPEFTHNPIFKSNHVLQIWSEHKLGKQDYSYTLLAIASIFMFTEYYNKNV